MKPYSFLPIVAAAIAFAGCSNAGGDLAKQSRDFGKCQLDLGDACGAKVPAGSDFKRATVAEPQDAVEISAVLEAKAECENYPKRGGGAPGVMTQIAINGIVVRPYNGPPVPDAIDKACAQSPYRVLMTVAKAR